MVTQKGDLVGEDPPQRFDKPARLSQRIKQLPACVAHLERELYEVKNRNLSQGAGALDEIGRPDHPAKRATRNSGPFLLPFVSIALTIEIPGWKKNRVYCVFYDGESCMARRAEE